MAAPFGGDDADEEERVQFRNQNFWVIRENWERAPPKYVRNPYIYYCQANYGRFARVLNTRMPQCVVRAMGQAWRNMEDGEKKPYVQMYLDDKKRYSDIKTRWMKSYKGRPPKYRKRNKYSQTWLGFEPPKRYRTAFIWFHAAMRPVVQAEFPNWDGPEQVQEIGERWRALTEEQKAPFLKKANEDMDRYLEDMRQFRRAIFRQEMDARVRNLETRLSLMRQRAAVAREERLRRQRAIDG